MDILKRGKCGWSWDKLPFDAFDTLLLSYVILFFWIWKKYTFSINNLRIIVRSNPRTLLSFHARRNAGHYQSTMTSHNDQRTWCHERKVRFLLKCQTSVRNIPRTRAFVTLRDDRYVWTDRNSLKGIDRHCVERKFSKIRLHKLHLKCIQNVSIAVINDNNNFAPSLFRFAGDCFGPQYFSSGAALPQKNNHLRFHTMTSKKMVRSYYYLNGVLNE